MTLLADMDTVIEDTQFGDSTITEIIDDVDTDGWCRCMCYCKVSSAERNSDAIEMMAGVDFGK